MLFAGREKHRSYSGSHQGCRPHLRPLRPPPRLPTIAPLRAGPHFVQMSMLSRRCLLPLALLLLAFAGAAGAGSKPDLARLYESQVTDPDQPPIILIHGLLGSTLIDPATRKQVWPGSLGTMAVS